MSTKHKRMTFVVTPDMEPIMDRAKKIFYDRTQSDMIRTLIMAGLDVMDEEQKGQFRKETDSKST